jgi:hypothetical protein
MSRNKLACRIKHQCICSSPIYRNVQAVADWLSEQIGYEFENGYTISSIDWFQVIAFPQSYQCIALCQINETDEEEEPGA